MEIRAGLLLFLLNVLVIRLSFAKSLSNAPNDERECDLLIKRLKREADNALADDDAYIEHLIKSTLHKEKQKCMDKYRLLEMPRHVEEVDELKKLRREVAKLKDLVSVVKDQRYILDALDNSAHSPMSAKATDTEDVEFEEMRKELTNMRRELHQAQADVDNHSQDFPKTKPSNQINEQLSRQQGEINNLKNLLHGVLIELKASTSGIKSTEKNPADMSNMIKELAALQKKLSEIQNKSASGSNASSSEVVGLQQNLQQAIETPIKNPQNENTRSSLPSQRSSESRLASERRSDDELTELLNVLAPKKSESSIETLLKSLDAESSDDALEQRLLNLEKQVKHKKKLQFEEKLKSLEKQLSGAQSKSGGDSDLSNNSELKRMLIKMIQKKNKEAQSKSLDDDVVLEELKELQKNIKSMSSDDDDLFGDLEEKNGQLDVTLEKLISAGGSSVSDSGHSRRKLSRGQIQALRRRLMAMKNGSAGGGDDYALNGVEAFESGHYSSGNDNGDFGHGNDYGPHWHITPGGNGYDGGPHSGNGHYSGHSDFGPGYGQSTYGGYPGKGYFHQSQGYNGYDSGPANSNYGNGASDPGKLYGAAGGYPGNIPTNQFGTPLYSYQPVPQYPTNVHSYSIANQGGNYGPGKYFAFPKGYSSMFGNSAPASNNVVPYPSSSASSPSSYQFFPSTHESLDGSYKAQSNSGAASPAQSYSNQPQAGPANPASVSDLKNQIYDLQGVINSFNKPEYLQKPEDKETVYNLNKQISELKGVVSNLQEPSYAQNNPLNLNGAPGDNGSGSYQTAHNENYASAANGANGPPSHLPELPPPAPSHQNQNPGPPAYPTEAPHARNFMEEMFRRKRSIPNKHEEALQTLALLIGNALNLHDEAEDEPKRSRLNWPQTPQVFQDINEKIADVRKQLDQHFPQHRPQAMRSLPLPSLRTPPIPRGTLRSNTDYGGYYDNNYYDKSYDIDTGLVKKDKTEKKSDIFDKIFDKIINKVIDKLEKAFPKIIEVIFGKVEYTKSYNNGYGESGYGNNGKYGEGYDSGNALVETFQSMGLSGMLPLIIVKILSKFQYVLYYLQKNKFFKTFLVPALMLLLVAGAVIFLVWWLQPNDDYNHYHQITQGQDNSYQDYNDDKMYRNSQQQELALRPVPMQDPIRYSHPKPYYSRSGSTYPADKNRSNQLTYANPLHFQKDFHAII